MTTKKTKATMLDLPSSGHEKEEEEDVVGYDSADEALCEMLGLDSFSLVEVLCDNDDSAVAAAETDNTISLIDPLQALTRLVEIRDEAYIQHILCDSKTKYDLRKVYENESVCVFPSELSIPPEVMRRLTDELVWGGDQVQADRTYETISVSKNNNGQHVVLEQQRFLTRLENFVNHHAKWNQLVHTYLARCVSVLMGEPMVLFKEKLNFKPPRGSGFAPHLDAPSLRVALLEAAAAAAAAAAEEENTTTTAGAAAAAAGAPLPVRTFVTVMVAIDNMTSNNGCLRLAKGKWTEENACRVIPPEIDGNPDAGGRAGAIPLDVADHQLCFEDLICKGGTIVAFNGWIPHRSGVNKSPFSRRAVFLTYNPLSEGNWHDVYYEKMDQLRSTWREKVSLKKQERILTLDEQSELDALATVPRI